MLTKQQCLSEELNPQSSVINLEDMHLRDAVYYAMDLYRKDGAVEFDKWKFNKRYWWHERKQRFVASWTYNEYTYEQLFELFLQSINQK